MPVFLIIGQARSGTTYVQTLMNAHPDIHCRGEIFDPYQIDDNGTKIQDSGLRLARDQDPAGFFESMMEGDFLGFDAPLWMGAKILVHHNPVVFHHIIANHPAIRILYVTRENKLAQFASALQVRQTKRWTETKDNAPAPPLIDAGPLWAASECNRLANEDAFLATWLSALPNPCLTLSYNDFLSPETGPAILSFLGLPPDTLLESPLKKQGQNMVLDRFQMRDEIAHHFDAVGLGHWLGPELT